MGELCGVCFDVKVWVEFVCGGVFDVCDVLLVFDEGGEFGGGVCCECGF